MTFNYDISLSGLTAAKHALKVTQNNVANINTEGYARERVSLSPSESVIGGGVEGQIGTGVFTEKIERIKDDLLIQQVRSQSTKVSYFKNMESGLSNIESITGELSDGSITNVTQDFFNSWEELSKYPTEKSYREQVVGSGKELAFKLNTVSEDLRVYRNELDNKIEVDIDSANSLAQQIARINKQIQNSDSTSPNALLDKRDYYLDKLSEIGDVHIVSNSKDPNLLDVELGGMMVVSGTNAQKIDGIYNKQEDRWVLAVGNVPMRLKEGSLVANLEVRNQYIPQSSKKIDELANVIITNVNSIHEQAYGLDGSTGHSFFVGTNASTIKVADEVDKNSDYVSVSTSPSETGNSDVARKLADLQQAPIMNDGKSPVEDWTGFVVSFGQKLSSISDSAEVYGNVLNDLTSQKQSVQGVDLDEELAKLMEYEKFFQSNGKVLQAIDGIFKDLLNMV